MLNKSILLGNIYNKMVVLVLMERNEYEILDLEYKCTYADTYYGDAER